METITKSDLLSNEAFYVSEIKGGKIFVYPTDTIYGIGCDALDETAVLKIREVKMRESKPFSVIAPGEDWIRKNCFVDEHVEDYLSKLPGPYTFILKLVNDECVAKNAVVGDLESLGVRIPDNWFADFLGKHGIVFVTTSVNVAGEEFIKNILDLKGEIAEKVDYVIDDGVLSEKPSKVVDLTSRNEKTIRD